VDRGGRVVSGQSAGLSGARLKGTRVPSPASLVAPLRIAAALVAATVVVTGCKVQLTDTAPGASAEAAAHHKAAHRKAAHHKAAHPKVARHPAAHHKAAPAPARAGAAALITEPGAGFGPLYRLIGDARHSIDVTMYEFADTSAEHDLAAMARRGVSVHVILDRREKSRNTAAYDYFRSHRIKVTWSSSSFEYTHQKTVTIDQSAAVILTANLTSEYYATSRDFLVIDRNHADIAAITRVFGADYAHRPVTPGDGRDLVWSPTDSQRQMLGLISGARRTLRIYSEEMADPRVDDALIAAARRGVRVQVCGENADGEYDSAFARLARAGVRISYFSSSTGFYIHGKVIEADYGTGRARAFIGSENFSATSLTRNRELGIITSAHPVLASIASTFAADFARGKRWG
jgi:cardiolipin synthase A/B